MRKVIMLSMVVSAANGVVFAGNVQLDPPDNTLPLPTATIPANANNTLPPPFATLLPKQATQSSDWTGFYAGVNGGYGWDENQTNFSPLKSPLLLPVNPTAVSFNSSGGIHGAQLGYDWQADNNKSLVVGVETDLDGSTITGSATQVSTVSGVLAPFISSNPYSTTEKIDWFGTVRPVVGMLTQNDRWLFYITAGMAYARLEDSANTDFIPMTERELPASKTITDFGWTGGGGVEWRFDGHISAGLQYLYLDFDSISANATETRLAFIPGASLLGVPAPEFVNMGYRWFNSANVLKLDLNYRF